MNDKDIDAMFSGRSSSKVASVVVKPVETLRSRFGNGFELVGYNKQTNDRCGKFRGWKVCLRTELHDRITLDGVSYKGKGYQKPKFYHCFRSSCSKCYRYGWGHREAGNIEARLKESCKRFGVVEHIVVSVPPKEYGLSYEVLHKKAIRVLLSRGIVGGSLIFHGGRYKRGIGYYWSPHWHCLGHVLGGFRRCRRCRKVCFEGCGGMKDRQRKGFREDGWIVKVFDERKTVFGTAKYELGHATVDTSKNRFRVVTYFGVCSYRRLKVSVERRKELCPICQHDLVWGLYFGSKFFVLNRDSPNFKRELFEPLDEDGCRVWVERVKREWGSGSYEEE